MAASAEHPLPEPAKPLLGLLNGIAQSTFYGNTEITEELLREQLYPETSSQEFGVLLAKMKGIIKGTEVISPCHIVLRKRKKWQLLSMH